MQFRLFPALIDRPQRIRFADQETDEEVELFLRRHPVTNIPWLLTTIVLIFLPSLIGTLMVSLGLTWVAQIPVNLSLALSILWLMIVLAYIIEQFLSWYFNIYIVTNRHLVDINFHNLLSRDKVEIRLEDIQSSKPSIKGVMASLFHYGDIVIETSAERQRIEFHAVPRPDFVAERIQDLQHKQEIEARGGHKAHAS